MGFYKSHMAQFFCGARPSWAAPFFDADGGGDGGGGGEGAAESGAEGGGEGVEGPPPSGGGEPAPEGDESLLSKAGKDGKPDGDPDGDGKDPPADAVTAESLVIPEGKEFDQALADDYLAIVNDESLSRADMAQKLLDMHASVMDKMLEGSAAASAAQEKEIADSLKATEVAWAEAAKKDSEYGGDKWEASQAAIAAGRDRLATPDVEADLNALGLGNHPGILRMFYRAGKLLGEDKGSGSGNTAPAPDNSKEKRAERMFGKSLEGLDIKGADD